MQIKENSELNLYKEFKKKFPMYNFEQENIKNSRIYMMKILEFFEEKYKSILYFIDKDNIESGDGILITYDFITDMVKNLNLDDERRLLLGYDFFLFVQKGKKYVDYIDRRAVLVYNSCSKALKNETLKIKLMNKFKEIRELHGSKTDSSKGFNNNWLQVSAIRGKKLLNSKEIQKNNDINLGKLVFERIYEVIELMLENYHFFEDVYKKSLQIVELYA